MRALLFDIDGTLTRSDGSGMRSLAAAVHAKARAAEELRKMRLDGMTDRAIVRTLLAAEHHEALPVEERARRVTPAEIDAVLAAYLEGLERACQAGAYHALPGLPQLLIELAQTSGVLLGLCTGNVERGARAKLSSAGLWEHFSFGGYGSDAELRADIVRAAWARSRERGAREALVIGDTPRDILAAHAAGLPACGVATGHFSLQELAHHGADVLLESFADTGRAVQLLLGPLPQLGDVAG